MTRRTIEELEEDARELRDVARLFPVQLALTALRLDAARPDPNVTEHVGWLLDALQSNPVASHTKLAWSSKRAALVPQPSSRRQSGPRQRGVPLDTWVPHIRSMARAMDVHLGNGVRNDATWSNMILGTLPPAIAAKSVSPSSPWTMKGFADDTGAVLSPQRLAMSLALLQMSSCRSVLRAGGGLVLDRSEGRNTMPSLAWQRLLAPDAGFGPVLAWHVLHRTSDALSTVLQHFGDGAPHERHAAAVIAYLKTSKIGTGQVGFTRRSLCELIEAGDWKNFADALSRMEKYLPGVLPRSAVAHFASLESKTGVITETASSRSSPGERNADSDTIVYDPALHLIMKVSNLESRGETASIRATAWLNPDPESTGGDFVVVRRGNEGIASASQVAVALSAGTMHALGTVPWSSPPPTPDPSMQEVLRRILGLPDRPRAVRLSSQEREDFVDRYRRHVLVLPSGLVHVLQRRPIGNTYSVFMQVGRLPSGASRDAEPSLLPLELIGEQVPDLDAMVGQMKIGGYLDLGPAMGRELSLQSGALQQWDGWRQQRLPAASDHGIA